ncbi:MFS transporter [Paenibacillus cremeus]|uniref:MFS transporter n=1 Tax=Paenibacillus cremeus TaxID=2163881 RepID=UPI00164803A8|nr:MFS transporter [Paenibacillus cremeus]
MKLWSKDWPRGVPLLLANSFLMSIGFYALIPNLSVYLTHSLGWAPLLAGVLLMVRQFSQQGLMTLTGMISDRVGYRLTISLGFVLRGIGFGMFALGTSPLLIFVSAIIAGIGGSLFEPTSDAALTTLTNVQNRSRAYAVKKVTDNLGIVVSALLGSLLVSVSFHLLSLISGALFVIAGIMTYIRLPSIRIQVKPVAWADMWRTVTLDQPFVHYVAVMIGYFFLFMQLYLAIPARIVDLTGQASSVSVVFLVLSIMIILFQVPVSLLVRRLHAIRAIQAGFALLGTGLLVLGFAGHVAVFVAGIALFTVGMMTIEPASFDLTSRLARPGMTATYFGFYYLAMAIGGGISQGTGGLLMQLGSSSGLPGLLWWIGAFVSLLAIAGAEPLRKSLPAK